MTTVDVISGFLGAGKTTILRRLIAQAYPGQRLVLLENEFGAVSVDSAFLRSTGVELAELNSGCICCSMSGDFTGQLQTLVEWEAPDRILIEPSGVAKLSDVYRGILQVQRACQQDEIVIGSLVTVVDASRAASYAENFGSFYLDQISRADCLLFTHTEGLGEDDIRQCCDLLRRYNHRARILERPQELSAAQLCRAFVHWQTEEDPQRLWKLLPGPNGRRSGSPSIRAKQEGQDIVSWARETRRRYSREGLASIIQALQSPCSLGQILRAKGSVAGCDDHWYEFDMLPGQVDIRQTKPAEPDVPGRICVIGCKLDMTALEELFIQGGVQ